MIEIEDDRHETDVLLEIKSYIDRDELEKIDVDELFMLLNSPNESTVDQSVIWLKEIFNCMVFMARPKNIDIYTKTD